MKNKKYPLFLKIFDIRLLVFDIGKITTCLFIWLWLRTKKIFLSGKKEKGYTRGKYIIASNHVSLKDHFVIYTVFPNRRVCYVATDDLFKGPRKLFFKATGTIPIDKEHGSITAIKGVKDTLNRGHVVGMFPEGILKDDGLKEFKGGIALMAASSHSDIAPIYIAPRKWWQRKVVIIGERLKYQDLFKSVVPNREEIRRVSELLMIKEKELENKYNELYETRRMEVSRPLPRSTH